MCAQHQDEPQNRRSLPDTRPFAKRHPRCPVTLHEAEVTYVDLLRAVGRLQKTFAGYHEAFGMTAPQYNILRILEGAKEPLAQQEIANRLVVSRSNVTGLIDKLEARGFVARHSNADRRVKMIHLTEAGLTFVEETFQSQLDVCLALLQPLEVEERQELRRLLRKVIGPPG